MAPTELSAVVVDDHPAVRAGVAHWLGSGNPPIRVAASGEDVRVAWLDEGADADVVIPMPDGVDSLNVAAAAAVALWELRAR